MEGSGIFDLEEKKVYMTDNNIPPCVEVEEALEGAEALERAETQEEAESDMQAEDIIPLLARVKLIRVYPNP